jgi:hypothetical protein
MGGPGSGGKPKPTPYRECVQCHRFIKRRRHPGGGLESRTNFMRRQFCSTECYWRARYGWRSIAEMVAP